MRRRFFRGRVKQPDELVDKIMRALERRREQLTYPAFYRAFGIAQAIAPTLMLRVSSRAGSGYKRPDET